MRKRSRSRGRKRSPRKKSPNYKSTNTNMRTTKQPLFNMDYNYTTSAHTTTTYKIVHEPNYDRQIKDLYDNSRFDDLKKLYIKRLIIDIMTIKRIYKRHAAKSLLSAELECVNYIAKFLF